MAKLEGMQAANRAFKKFSIESRAKIVAALEKGGDEIAEAARALAPVSNPRAGASHVAEDIKPTRVRIIRRASRENLFVRVSAGAGSMEDFNAAWRAEFGRKPGPTPAEGRPHPGQSAQPFLFPAYWARRKRVVNRVKRVLKQAARRAAGLPK